MNVSAEFGMIDHVKSHVTVNCHVDVWSGGQGWLKGEVHLGAAVWEPLIGCRRVGARQLGVVPFPGAGYLVRLG